MKLLPNSPRFAYRTPYLSFPCSLYALRTAFSGHPRSRQDHLMPYPLFNFHDRACIQSVYHRSFPRLYVRLQADICMTTRRTTPPLRWITCWLLFLLFALALLAGVALRAFGCHRRRTSKVKDVGDRKSCIPRRYRTSWRSLDWKRRSFAATRYSI